MQLKLRAAKAIENVNDVQAVQKTKSLSRFVPKAVTRSSGRLVLRAQKNSPQLLFVAGLGFGAATVVTACRTTLKLEGVLEDLRSDLDDTRNLETGVPDRYSAEDAKRDRAIIYTRSTVKIAKLYGPSFALGVLSVASLTGSHHIMSKRNVALVAAYKTVEKSFDEYRSRVVNEYGEDKERELRYGVRERTIVEETDKGPKTTRVKSFGKGTSPYSRVWDAVSSREWRPNSYSNRTFIQCQQNWANDLLQSRGHLFLNEVHDMLGLERTTAGQVVGWVLGNGDDYVDFGIFDRQHSDERVYEFMFGEEKSILLDFNVDGMVYDLLDKIPNKTN